MAMNAMVMLHQTGPDGGGGIGDSVRAPVAFWVHVRPDPGSGEAPLRDRASNRAPYLSVDASLTGCGRG